MRFIACFDTSYIVVASWQFILAHHYFYFIPSYKVTIFKDSVANGITYVFFSEGSDSLNIVRFFSIIV